MPCLCMSTDIGFACVLMLEYVLEVLAMRLFSLLSAFLLTKAGLYTVSQGCSCSVVTVLV